MSSAVLSAILNLIIFVGVPYLLPDLLPYNLTNAIESAGLNLDSVLRQITTIGIITSALILLKGTLKPESLHALAVSIIQNLSILMFSAVFLSIGDISSIGVSSFVVNMENAVNLIRLDLRFFIYLSVFTVLLQTLKSYYEWREARQNSQYIPRATLN
jgi:hypothetical protein